MVLVSLTQRTSHLFGVRSAIVATIFLLVSLYHLMFLTQTPDDAHFERRLMKHIPTSQTVLALSGHDNRRFRGTSDQNLSSSIFGLGSSKLDMTANINDIALKFGWDRETRTFQNPDFLENLKLQQFRTKLNSKSKRGEWLNSGDRPIEDLFDIVIIAEASDTSSEAWSEFLSSWKFLIEKFNVIIIQLGTSSSRIVDVPIWAQYELYNQQDISNVLGTESWLFDLSDSSGGVGRSFACLVSDKDFLFFLDRYSAPVKDSDGNSIDPIEEHLVNLLTPSTPYYFNSHHHPFSPGTDFARGYPYSLRNGVLTAVSQGPVLHWAEYDATTRLAKLDEVESRTPGLVTTVTAGALFSLSCTNLAVRRRLVGPLLYFGSGVFASAGYDIGDKNTEVFTGWIVKTALDHLGAGVLHGGKGYVKGNYSKNPLELLRQDLVWNPDHERIVRLFSEFTLSSESAAGSTNATAAVFEIARFIEAQMGEIHPAYAAFAKALRAYATVWERAQDNTPDQPTRFLPVASRSSLAPPVGSVGPVGLVGAVGPVGSVGSTGTAHGCAAFTIMHNETTMLPLWLKYYNKFFPGSLFVLDHFLNTSGDAEESTLKAMELNVSSIAPGIPVRYLRLFGDKDGFPVAFLVRSAQMFQRRLFRAGYKCVLYTDVDEFVAPDPKKFFKNGLKEYLEKFMADPKRLHARTMGYNVGHAGEQDGSSPPLEAPMDWSKPILSQRSFWIASEWYNKPVLSKIPVKWNVGFHTTTFPAQIDPDPELFLLHMAEVDKTYCLAREERKYLAITASGKDFKSAGGFNFHIWNYPEMLKQGLVCRYALSVFIKARGAAFDNLGKMVLEKMDPAWRSVDL